MSELKALIFDVDGTLADNEQDGHRVAFNRAFEEAGFDWHWDEEIYEQLLTVFGGKERIHYYLRDFLEGFTPPADTDEFVRDLHAQKTRHYVALLQSGAIPLRPGVERLLREAHASAVRLAIASTTTLENATTLLSRTLGEDSIEWFDVIACGDIVANKKPAPDIYLYALEKLGLSAAECLVVEDTESGLASARAAGLRCVITVNHCTHNQDFSGATIVLNHLGEPDQPFSVLQGDGGNSNHADMALLRRLHSD